MPTESQMERILRDPAKKARVEELDKLRKRIDRILRKAIVGDETGFKSDTAQFFADIYGLTPDARAVRLATAEKARPVIEACQLLRLSPTTVDDRRLKSAIGMFSAQFELYEGLEAKALGLPVDSDDPEGLVPYSRALHELYARLT